MDHNRQGVHRHCLNFNKPKLRNDMSIVQKSTGKHFPHQIDQTKPLPKGLGSQAMGPAVCWVPFMSECSKLTTQTLPLGRPPSWEGLCHHFGVFLHDGDPPHRAPAWLPSPQGSASSTGRETVTQLPLVGWMRSMACCSKLGCCTMLVDPFNSGSIKQQLEGLCPEVNHASQSF